MADTSGESSAKTGSEALAQLIRDRREQLGMSRQELADATGVPYPTIAQIETAYRGASPGRLGVIARALGLDPAELYDVLASDSGAASAATEPTRRSRRMARARSDGGWLANAAYAPQSAPPLAAPAALAALAREAPSRDVVEQVIALLSALPAHERLEVLGRVQGRLLSGLVQEEVQQATRRPRER